MPKRQIINAQIPNKRQLPCFRKSLIINDLGIIFVSL